MSGLTIIEDIYMRTEPGIVVIDNTSDLLSLRCPTQFKVLRNRFLSAWHYLLYMKAMRLQLYGSTDRILQWRSRTSWRQSPTIPTR